MKFTVRYGDGKRLRVGGFRNLSHARKWASEFEAFTGRKATIVTPKKKGDFVSRMLSGKF